MPLNNSADPPLTDHTVYLFSQLGRAGKNMLRAQLAVHGLTMRDMAALSVLDETGPISQAALGKRLALDPSDVTALVDDMGTRGFVIRTVDADDRRRRLIGCTVDGMAALKTARRITRRVDNKILEPLGLELRQELHAALVRILVHARSL